MNLIKPVYHQVVMKNGVTIQTLSCITHFCSTTSHVVWYNMTFEHAFEKFRLTITRTKWVMMNTQISGPQNFCLQNIFIYCSLISHWQKWSWWGRSWRSWLDRCCWSWRCWQSLVNYFFTLKRWMGWCQILMFFDFMWDLMAVSPILETSIIFKQTLHLAWYLFVGIDTNQFLYASIVFHFSLKAVLWDGMINFNYTF